MQAVEYRQLDLVIAEKVMGCKINRATEPGLSQMEYELRRNLGDACGCPDNLHAAEWGWSFEPYSTDIAAAWKVVEKLTADKKEKWFYNALWCDPNTGQWGFGDFDQDGSFFGGDMADTAPLAICLAALGVFANAKA